MSLATGPERQQESGETQETSAPASTPRRKRRRWWLLAVVLMLVATLWFLPGLVAHTPLLDWILAKAASNLKGTVTVQSASLGWFSPIAADRIEVRDEQDRTVLEAARVRGDKSLVSILRDLSRLGQFRLEQPKLHVVLRDDGSNVEDLLENYLTSTEEPAEIGIALEVVDGSVSITDQGGRQLGQIEKLNVALNVPAGGTEPLKLQASGTIADPQRPGRFDVKLTMRPGPPADRTAKKDSTPQPASTGSGELTAQLENVPLAILDALAGRFMPETHLDGRLGSDVHVLWGGEGAEGKTIVQADVRADDFLLTAPPLGTDRVELSSLQAAGQLAWHDGRLVIEGCTIESDVLSASLVGDLDLGDAAGGDLLASLPNQTCQLSGRVDLARLAQMLPTTLRIRQGMQVDSGQVQWALVSKQSPVGSGSATKLWQGNVEVSDLTAVDQGRRLTWKEPIRVELAAYQSPQGPVVDTLKCTSDFLTFHARGTTDNLVASANLDLKQLAGQLGQFVDLGGIDLGGGGWAQLNWKRADDGRFETDAEIQLQDFRLAMPEQEPWVEQNLGVILAANGRTDFTPQTRLQEATLSVRAGSDQIDARLTRPVIDFRDGGTWPLHVTMKGQLENWPARLRTWLPMDDCRLAGAFDLDAQATGSTSSVTVRQAKLTLANLQVQTPSLNVHESAAELVVSGTWDREGRQLEVDPATLTTGSLSLRADQLVLAMPEGKPPKMNGLVQYTGDLGRLRRWFAEPDTAPTWQMAGQLAGTAKLEQTAGVIDGQLQAKVDNLIVVTASGEKFHEPLTQLTARGSYQTAENLILLEHLELASGAASGTMSGRIARADEQTNVELDGQVTYDLQRLTGLLRPYLGPRIAVAGSGASPISYHGPLALERARAAAAVGWQRADVYGFPIGPGQLQATLADGMMRVEPMDLAVSGGRMRLAPQVRLAQPRELTLPAGQLAEKIQITPEMCNDALKYIAPVLAGVTSAQGTFSIEMQGCRIPLNDPAQGELAGKFTIHAVQIGPGPLVRELALLLGYSSPAQLRRESVIPFRMVRGRVYHEGLELVFPELTIRTMGSVGLDQTLQMMAEMPIPSKWFGDTVVGQALRDRTIQVPIAGTLTKPTLDRRAFDRLAQQFLKDAATDVLRREVSKGLESLFGPPPQP